VKGNEAYAALMRFFVVNHLLDSGGATRVFYSPQEWTARGEEYSQRALLVVTYDGGFHRAAMTVREGKYELNDKMQKALGAIGCYFGEGTSWYGGVYPIG
jgi:hypothetical protein